MSGDKTHLYNGPNSPGPDLYGTLKEWMVFRVRVGLQRVDHWKSKSKSHGDW